MRVSESKPQVAQQRDVAPSAPPKPAVATEEPSRLANAAVRKAEDTFEAKPAAAPQTTANTVATTEAQLSAQAAKGPEGDFAARRAQHAVKVEQGVPPKTYDGMYIGADGYAYPPSKFKASEVPPFKPNNPPVPQPAPTQYYVNGVLTWPSGSQQAADGTFLNPEQSVQADGEAQKIANTTGTNVVLIYNATESEVADFAQAAGDVNRVGNNPAATTLANAIYDDVKAGREVRVSGYSQGGAITARALHDVRDRLYNDTGGVLGHLPGVGEGNRRELDRLMGQIKVTTYAGAGANFPDGPSYDHYVNSQDPVPNFAGVGSANLSHPGRGARVHTFDEAGAPGAALLSPEGVHGIGHYLEAQRARQAYDKTVSNAPPELRATLGKAGMERVQELTQELGLSPTQLYDVARNNPSLFTRGEGNGLVLNSFVDMAKDFGLKGDSAAGLLQALGKGTEDSEYALNVFMHNVQRLSPQPNTKQEWLQALGAEARRAGAPDDYRRAFANAEAYLRARD